MKLNCTNSLITTYTLIINTCVHVATHEQILKGTQSIQIILPIIIVCTVQLRRTKVSFSRTNKLEKVHVYVCYYAD